MGNGATVRAPSDYDVTLRGLGGHAGRLSRRTSSDLHSVMIPQYGHYFFLFPSLFPISPYLGGDIRR